jgi:hypothetical protein
VALYVAPVWFAILAIGYQFTNRTATPKPQSKAA